MPFLYTDIRFQLFVFLFRQSVDTGEILRFAESASLGTVFIYIMYLTGKNAKACELRTVCRIRVEIEKFRLF